MSNPKIPTPGPVAWWHPKGDQFAHASPDGSRPFAAVWEPLYTRQSLYAYAEARVAAAVAQEWELYDQVCEQYDIAASEIERLHIKIQALEADVARERGFF